MTKNRTGVVFGAGTLALVTLFTPPATGQNISDERPPVRPSAAMPSDGQVLSPAALGFGTAAIPSRAEADFADSSAGPVPSGRSWQPEDQSGPTNYAITPRIVPSPAPEKIASTPEASPPLAGASPQQAPSETGLTLSEVPWVDRARTELQATDPILSRAEAGSVSEDAPGVNLSEKISSGEAGSSPERQGPPAPPVKAVLADTAKDAETAPLADDTTEISEMAPTESPVESSAPRQEPEKASSEPQADVIENTDIVTNDITPTTFPGLRKTAMENLSAEGAGVDEQIELIRVLTGGVFFPEASHTAATLRESGKRLSPGQEMRLRNLEKMIFALSGEGPGGDTGSLPASPWSAAEAAAQAINPDTGLWDLIPQIREGKTPDSDTVRAAAASLGKHSEWVAVAVTPDLLKGALLSQDFELASLIIETAEMSGGTSLAEILLMRGDLARMTGQDEEAFDFYAEAMELDGVAAVEARIAFSDMVMEKGSPGALLNLRDILKDGVRTWRNDDYSRRLMTRLAAVTEEIGDTEEAIRVMARIVAEYPGTDEARLAQARVPVLLQSLQEDMNSGEIRIDEYIPLIRELSWKIDEGQEWVSARVLLAEKLAENGLHAAASAEFEDIRSRHANQIRDSGLLRNRVILGEAASKVASGDQDGARRALATPLGGDDPEEQNRRDALFLRSGMSGEIPQDPYTEEDLSLLRARDLFADGDNEGAARFYDNFIGSGKPLPPEDASRYILARSRTSTGKESVSNTQGIQSPETDSMITAGASIAAESPQMSPISTGSAMSIIGEAEAAISAAGNILSATEAPGDATQ